MAKLIIQIPCYNEIDQLESTIQKLPKAVSGFDKLEILVIDDGSSDGSHKLAEKAGATKIVRLKKHQGLARVFAIGVKSSLEMGADVMVNYDADAQFPPEQIEQLIKPILSGQADMTIGCRDMKSISHYSWSKKLLQRAGSWVVRKFSGTEVADTTSGFRALNRNALEQINVISPYTYTLETIIQAGHIGLAIETVPVSIKPSPRKSRLISSNSSYIARSVATILRIYMMYQPLKTFGALGAVFFGAGLFLDIRYLVLYFYFGDRGHIQSLLLSAILLIIGFLIWVLGLLADLVSANRTLIEDSLVHLRKISSLKSRE